MKRYLVFLTTIVVLLFANFSVCAFAECNFSDGSISITNITPALGSVIESKQRYTFDVTVQYQFSDTNGGIIGILAADVNSLTNLDNQAQDNIYVDTRKGKKTIHVTADISVNGNPVNVIEIVPLLSIPDCRVSAVNDIAYFVTSEGPSLSAFPLDGPHGEYEISQGFYDIYKKKRHLGVDIMAPYDTPVYAVCPGIVEENSTSNAPTYNSYWNSVLIIKHYCDNGMTVYGYYGHIFSNLQPGEYVSAHNEFQFPIPIGTIRKSYSTANEWTPNSDHLHFGLSVWSSIWADNPIPPIKPWGYAPLNKSCSSLLLDGWLNPEVFLTWGRQTNACQ